ncbi:MAG: 4Fe-4S binding protein [Aeromicrobium sp.]
MTYVITQGCCNDASCISVCPVQCIRPRPGDPDFTTAEQLYIDPATCIDCAACMDECPVNAIEADYDLPAHLGEYLAINEEYFEDNPITDTSPVAAIRHKLPADRPELRVAVVGTGPAACYAIGELSATAGVAVSVFERLPTPFGLLRSGVAPDHASTKLIGEQFRGILARKSVTCFFNVEVGRDISVDELLEHHHAVIWAGGAAGDKTLGIEGEDLPGSHSAREFVAWYNGHPDHATDQFDLSGERVVVLGNGNVALDVARALTRPVAVFERSDMADHAIAALRGSQVTEVVVAARRGPGQVASTTAELLALTQLEGVDLVARPEEVDADPTPHADTAGAVAIAARKNAILTTASRRTPNDTNRRIAMRFLMIPRSINGTDRVESITFDRAEITAGDDGLPVVRATGEEETIETGLVLRAIGYRSTPVAGLPYSDLTGTIPHQGGRVLDPEAGATMTGVYCTGWVKRGASGVIGTNKADSVETVVSLIEDFAAGQLRDPAGDAETLKALVAERSPDHLDNAGWLRINQAERSAGSAEKRPRVKFVSVEQMLAASRTTG